MTACDPLKGNRGRAQGLGLQLQSLEVRSPDDFESAFDAAIRRSALDALIVTAHPVSILIEHRS